MLACLTTPGQARPAAIATPVPFPSVPAPAPALADVAALQTQPTHLEGFLNRADDYTRNLHGASDRYRQYLAHMQKALASCQVQADGKGQGSHPFAGLIAGEERQCDQPIATLKQQARVYGTRLDAAVTFARRLEEGTDSAQRQVDRVRMLQHASRLKVQVDEGLELVKKSRKMLKPWMGPSK